MTAPILPSRFPLIVAAYGIGFGVSLIREGGLGDIFRIVLLGIAGFTLASTLCGLAPTPGILIASRVVQAICAAIVTPRFLAIIQVQFAVDERPIAIGMYALAGAVGSDNRPCGPAGVTPTRTSPTPLLIGL